MLNNIKNRLKIITDPKDIYESNYLLFLVLKSFFYLPLSITFQQNSRITLQTDYKNCLVSLSIIIYILWKIVEDIANYSYRNDVNPLYNVIFIASAMQVFSIISSILVCYILAFTRTKNFFKIICALKILDDKINDGKIAELIQKLGSAHKIIFVLFFVFACYVTIVIILMSPQMEVNFIVQFLLIGFIPFINVALTNYHYITIIFISRQRFGLIADRIEEVYHKNNNSTWINQESHFKINHYLNSYNLLLDVIEKFNENFGALISSAIVASYIWIIVYIFNLMQMHNIPALKGIIFILTAVYFILLVAASVALLLFLVYMCDK